MNLINLLLMSFGLGGDVGATLQGSVRAESSREPIANASVVVTGLNRGVMTNENGVFVLAGIPEGRWEVRTSALGYRTHTLTIISAGRGAVRLDLELERQPVELKPVEARTSARNGDDAGLSDMPAGPPALHVSGTTLKRVPALAEADVLRALQTLPSVSAISDYSSALYVRGGSPDQTLISLDGVPLFNPYHLGGLFAAIDPDAVASVDAYSGALPSRAGDRVSGAVQIHTREGGKDRLRAQGAIGLISSRASVDGPFSGGKGSYLVSARHTYIDLFTAAAYKVKLIDGQMPYGFSDAHLKLTRSIGPLGSFSATVYLDREGISIPERMKQETDMDMNFAWGSKAASISYRQALGNSVLGDFRVGFSDFTGTFDAIELRRCQPCIVNGVPLNSQSPLRTIDAHTTQRDLLANADFTWYRATHELRTGVAIDSYLFDHDILTNDSDLLMFVPSFKMTDRPTTLATYLEDEWSISDALQVRAGGRVLSAGELGTATLPRIGARVLLAHNLTLSAGAGRYAQVMSSLRNEESLGASLVAYDLLAARNLIKGEDVVVGAEWRPSGFSIRVDAYSKRTRNVLLPTTYGDAIEAPVIVLDSVAPGRIRSRGIETMARFERGGTDIALSYSLSSTDITVNGATFPARFDRRHLLDVTATQKLGRRGEVSTRIALASGQPFTRVVGTAEPYKYDPNLGGFWPGFLPRNALLGEHNSDRLGGYFRVDIALRKEFDKHWFGRDLTIAPYLQVINALNSKNTLIADPSALGQLRLKHYPQLPLLPTLGFEWHF